MKKLLRLVHSAYFFGVGALTVIFGYFACSILVLLGFPERKAFFIWGRIWARIMLATAGCRARLYGADNLPKNEVMILASNHQGVFDVLLLLATLPVRYRFVMDDWLFAIPFFGRSCRRAGALEVKTTGSRRNFALLKQMIRAVKEGDSILLFPEGRRTPDHKLNEFKEGVAVVAAETGAPVLPLAISGSFHVLKRGGRVFHPGTLILRIGKSMRYPQNSGGGVAKPLEFARAIQSEVAHLLSHHGQGV